MTAWPRQMHLWSFSSTTTNFKIRTAISWWNGINGSCLPRAMRDGLPLRGADHSFSYEHACSELSTSNLASFMGLSVLANIPNREVWWTKAHVLASYIDSLQASLLLVTTWQATSFIRTRGVAESLWRPLRPHAFPHVLQIADDSNKFSFYSSQRSFWSAGLPQS